MEKKKDYNCIIKYSFGAWILVGPTLYKWHIYLESYSTPRVDWNDIFMCPNWYLGEWEIDTQSTPIEIKIIKKMCKVSHK